MWTNPVEALDDSSEVIFAVSDLLSSKRIVSAFRLMHRCEVMPI